MQLQFHSLLPAIAASSRHRNRNAVPLWTRIRPPTRIHHSVAPHRPVPDLLFLPEQALCRPRERLHSRDASLFGKLLARVAAATPADAQHVCAPHDVCAGNARPPGVAMNSAPVQHTRPRSRHCRDRKRCRCLPACRSPDIRIAARSSHAPHAQLPKTLDKLVQCAHNMQADLAHQAPHRRPGVRPRKSFPGPSPQSDLRLRIAKIAQRNHAPFGAITLRPIPTLKKNRQPQPSTAVIRNSRLDLFWRAA
jgi:hypothetical protein